jgi:hypothetical protein
MMKNHYLYSKTNNQIHQENNFLDHLNSDLIDHYQNHDFHDYAYVADHYRNHDFHDYTYVADHIFHHDYHYGEVSDSKNLETENLHWDECNLYNHDDQFILGSCDYHDKHACKRDNTANQPTLKIRKGDNLKSTKIDPTKGDNHISDGSIQIEKSDVN